MTMVAKLCPDVAAIGIILFSLMRWFVRRPVASTSTAENDQLIYQSGNSTGSEPVAQQKDIQFLYDKRLALFNFRRDHEWKIYFGALWMLGVIDAGFVTGHLNLHGSLHELWPIACGAVFVCVFEYERAVQLRNNSDRTSMRLLFNTLCRLAGVDDARVLERKPQETHWNSFGYAFPWQVALLLVATELSISLVWLQA
jgi:hypothetical protein